MLKSLFIDCNKFESVNPLYTFTALEECYVDSNRIYSFDTLTTLINLDCVSASNNSTGFASAFQCLNNLE